MPAFLPENTSPDLRASTLAPKEPYHVPGYAGYRPQYKYQCSETFGNTTHRLLTSDSVRKSTSSVLRPIDPPRSQTVPLGFHDVPKVTEDKYDLDAALSKRGHKWGDQLLKPNMRSGYMGFVPKAHFSSYHSKTFPEICNAALKDFADDQTNHSQKTRQMFETMQMQEASNLSSAQRENLMTSHKLPLRAVRASMPQYRSPNAFKRHESPYFLEEEHPQKHFRSGFAGHVPFYKDLGGHGYPIVTNRALKEFSRERERIFLSAKKDVDGKSVVAPRPPRKSLAFSTHAARHRIFLADSGVIPRYAGYVPGQKFRFGHTFGHSTENPLKLNPTPTNVPILSS